MGCDLFVQWFKQHLNANSASRMHWVITGLIGKADIHASNIKAGKFEFTDPESFVDRDGYWLGINKCGITHGIFSGRAPDEIHPIRRNPLIAGRFAFDKPVRWGYDCRWYSMQHNRFYGFYRDIGTVGKQ